MFAYTSKKLTTSSLILILMSNIVHVHKHITQSSFSKQLFHLHKDIKCHETFLIYLSVRNEIKALSQVDCFQCMSLRTWHFI